MLAGIVSLAGPAQAVGVNLYRATAGYLYFNKPGAEMATHDADLANCFVTWQGGVIPGNTIMGIGATGVVDGLIAGAVQNQMMKGWERARLAVNVEHCMVARGWRLVRLPEAEGRKLAALDRQALTATLAPWVGADIPEGQIVRVWRNEAAMGEEGMRASSPQGASQTLLSSLSMSEEALPSARSLLLAQDRVRGPQDPSAPRRVSFSPGAWLAVPTPLPELSPAELSSLPPGAALLIIKMSGAKGASLRFERDIGLRPEKPYAEIVLGRLWKATVVNGRREKIFAFAVPPGKWRLLATGSTFDFCLGSPAFEVAAGDVVYMGGFNVEPGVLVQPDMSLEPARELLGAGSELAAKLRPAAWVNGSTAPCRNWHPYAYEFSGHPYEPGYSWAGASVQAPGP
ncbi:MAG: hypothetical protein Q8J89_01370 [Caulobacter sp.]|nr:hypothetical protein [Caulobacter sp.]